MNKLITLLVVCYSLSSFAQKLPDEMYFSDNGKILYTGGQQTKGLYNESKLKKIYLKFDQANYWQLLTNNYKNKIDIPATLTLDGEVFDSVGVRFKGQTSYSMSGTSPKKSFNITMDYVHPGQDLKGYQTLNLNNAFQDASFLREIFYLHQIRNHTPAAKGNFVQLYINGEHWGLYPNVQQLNKDYLKEWFFSNNGTNWRADRPDGSIGGGGGGPAWGDGTAALNYLGDDSTKYKTYYTLKSTDKSDPWTDLIETTKVLNTTASTELESALADKLDIDRALWFLASEIIYTDDDSYVYKGKMDYYIYQDAETGRITPMDYDGNSVMETNFVTWSPFYNETKVNYPLLNKLLAVPNLRQRYLAHMRTLITEGLDTAKVNAVLNGYVSMVDSVVLTDTKKSSTYAQFKSEVQVLKNFIVNRKKNLLANTEVNKEGPVISQTDYFVNNLPDQSPKENEEVLVTTTVSHTSGIDHVDLYVSTGLYGKFTKSPMFDDGLHQDGLAGDGIYGATIPGYSYGTWVRYYIEAVAANTAKSASYDPVGAEHDVYVYKVKTEAGNSDVVINEIMARNITVKQDEAGEYEDWIELYNRSNNQVDLTGYSLSDEPANIQKWNLPEGTTLDPDQYLIVWADEDQTQGPLHANFKLSADGERITLSNPDGDIVDSLTYGIQEEDLGWARIPNGFGNFVSQAPTFAANNQVVTLTYSLSDDPLNYFPNPASNYVIIKARDNELYPVYIYNSLGQLKQQVVVSSGTTISTENWENGFYYFNSANKTSKIYIQH